MSVPGTQQKQLHNFSEPHFLIYRKRMIMVPALQVSEA